MGFADSRITARMTPSRMPITIAATVTQMVSRVSARLRPGLDAVDVLRTIFPCGSVTGAPKIAAMKALRALEPHQRGAYCGSAGWIEPGGDAADLAREVALQVGVVGDHDVRVGAPSPGHLGVAGEELTAAIARALGAAFADFLEAPELIVDKMGPQNRVGRIFVDYLRNQRGASTVAAYSVRARPGLAVSVPVEREELAQLERADRWNIGNLDERLRALRSDPWARYGAVRQRLTQALLKRLEKG